MKAVWQRVFDSRISGILLILLILALWEVLVRARVIDTISVPTFSGVVSTWAAGIASGDLPINFYHTLRRMFFGYVAAAVVGVAIGLAMGYFRTIYNLLEPITEFLRPLPSPAYIPLVILFLGIRDGMKIFVIFFACIWPIVLNTYAGVRAVQPVQINTARTFGLNHRQMLRKVVVPSAAPNIFTGLRVSLAIALILSIITEMVASSDGIGHYILFAQRSFRVEEVYAGVVSLAIVGYLLNYLFVRIEGKLLRWHVGSTNREPA